METGIQAGNRVQSTRYLQSTRYQDRSPGSLGLSTSIDSNNSARGQKRYCSDNDRSNTTNGKSTDSNSYSTMKAVEILIPEESLCTQHQNYQEVLKENQVRILLIRYIKIHMHHPLVCLHQLTYHPSTHQPIYLP